MLSNRNLPDSDTQNLLISTSSKFLHSVQPFRGCIYISSIKFHEKN
jgi:hypothetical protein